MSTRASEQKDKRVPSHLGVQHSATPRALSCECPKSPKNPLPKCPDGEPVTVNYQGLTQIVSEFPRATPRQAN